MIDIIQYVDIVEKVRITFTDDMYVEGHIESVDDEEESELGEPGLSFWTDDGTYMGIGQSEIKRIEIIN
jgi:hypothetical protein